MTDRLVAGFAELPELLRLGMFVFAIGVVLDFIFYAAPDIWSGLFPFLGNDAKWAEVITLIGMLLIMAGIIWEEGVRIWRRRQSVSPHLAHREANGDEDSGICCAD